MAVTAVTAFARGMSRCRYAARAGMRQEHERGTLRHRLQ
jgi:hypothetical protein